MPAAVYWEGTLWQTPLAVQHVLNDISGPPPPHHPLYQAEEVPRSRQPHPVLGGVTELLVGEYLLVITVQGGQVPLVVDNEYATDVSPLPLLHAAYDVFHPLVSVVLCRLTGQPLDLQ